MRKVGQGNNLARLKILVLKVFSNDFATVDVREELCYVLCGNKTNPPVRASFEYLAAHPHCNTSVYCRFVFAAIFSKICSLRLRSNGKRRVCPTPT